MKIIIECKCGNKFETKQSRINSGRGKYCSMDCKYKFRKKRSGYKCIKHKENPTSFVKGQIPWNKGKKGVQVGSKKCKGLHASPETEFKKGMKPWNFGKPYVNIRDDNHHNWVGDDVGYGALHSWVHRKLGKASYCNICFTDKSKRYHWHNISGEYKRDLSDWESLCTKCHFRLHREIRQQKLQKVC